VTKLGRGGEFDLIRSLEARWGALAVGLGDDAALLSAPRGETIVVSTDSAVEGIHFRRDWMSLREIGHRATAAALSDLAAVAAAPLGVLIAFTTRVDSAHELLEVADGIGDAVRDAGTVVVGGNLSKGPSLGITTTVIGSAFSPLTRSAARVGDAIYVTGRLGGPSAATRALTGGAAPAPEHRARFVTPAPRLREARWLAARGATAAIDISDGLSRDAEHLAVASNVSLEIDVDRVPRLEGVTPDDALGGGEEYELLVTGAEGMDGAAFVSMFTLPLTRIGLVIAGRATPEVLLTRDGKRVAAPSGYDHFSR
jgi:thiamine-monophosphate kinase